MMADENNSNVDDNDVQPSPTSSSSKKKMMMCVLLLVVVLIYLFVGALVFHALERPVAVKSANDFDAALLQFASENDCLNVEDVHDLMKIVTRAIGEGGYDSSLPYATYLNMETVNKTFFSQMWSFGESFLFSATVISTIGFGYIAPRTRISQFVCVLYALIGIPFTATVIWSVKQILTVLSLRLGEFIRKWKVCSVRRPRLWTAGVVLFSILLAHLFMLVPSCLMYYYTMDWSYIDSQYFVFVLMTTIGFGDLRVTYPSLPAVQRIVVKVVHYTYFIVCLSVLSTMLDAFSKAQQRGVIIVSSCLTRHMSVCHRRRGQDESDNELEVRGTQELLQDNHPIEN